MNRTLAVFDVDRTLIRGDSLWPFLVYVAGLPRALLALAEASVLFLLQHWRGKNDPTPDDPRTFIKAHLLRRLLAGRKVDQLTSAIEKLHAWRRWNEPMRKTLFDHAAEGRQIVIASGALDLYLPALLGNLPAHVLLCTDMETKDGIITGVMRSGNCVRARKAEMLAAYLAENGPFEESWGYGNFPHDVPMLNLLNHRVIVS